MTPNKAEALRLLELMRKRAHSHAAISNSPKHMAEWIDSDAKKIEAFINSQDGFSYHWNTTENLPDNGHYAVWIEYIDRSGTGFCREAFLYNGVWDVSGFDDWDKKYKEVTHWMPRFNPPAPASPSPKEE